MLATVAFLAGLSPAEAETVQGKIFDSIGGMPSFFYEKSDELREGKRRIHSQYLDKNRKVLAEEICVLEGSRLVKYEYFQRQMEEHGSAEIRDGKIHYSFTKQGKTETDSDDVEPNLIVSETVGDFLRENWHKIMADETVKARLILVERLETIGFKFFKDKEQTLNGKNVVYVTMKPSSIFLDALIPNFSIVLEKDPPHRTVQSYGRLPIRVPEVPNPTKRTDYRAIDASMTLEYSK